MTPYAAVLTDAGQALYAAALAGNTAIQLAQMAVGDGGGAPVAAPDPTRAALVNQVYSGPLGSLWVDPANPALMWAQCLIGPAVGGFTIREAGLLTANGTLFAIANFPDTIKPVLANGSAVDLAINFGLTVADTALITLDINPGIVGATQAWVLATVTPASLLPGGGQYQVLQKNSANNGDVGWADPGAPWETAIATTGGATALTAQQAMAQIIVVSGALTANATLAFPAAVGRWTVVNNTTGPYALTALAVGGSGVAIFPDSADTVYCDGANIHYAATSALTRPPNDGSPANATTAYVDRAVADIGGYYADTGLANAYVIATVPATLAYANGMTFRFKAAHANTGACTLNAGAGAQPLVRDDGAALQAGDLPAATLIAVIYNLATASWILGTVVYSQFGSAARLNASDAFGTVAATQVYAGNPNGAVAGNAAVVGVSAASQCWDPTAGFLWVCSVSGSTATAVWARTAAVAGQWGYVNAACTLLPGLWKLDSSGGPFSVALEAAPAAGDNYAFEDCAGSFATNPVTLTAGANTIEGLASFPLNVPWSAPAFTFKSSNWSMT